VVGGSNPLAPTNPFSRSIRFCVTTGFAPFGEPCLDDKLSGRFVTPSEGRVIGGRHRRVYADAGSERALRSVGENRGDGQAVSVLDHLGSVPPRARRTLDDVKIRCRFCRLPNPLRATVEACLGHRTMPVQASVSADRDRVVVARSAHGESLAAAGRGTVPATSGQGRRTNRESARPALIALRDRDDGSGPSWHAPTPRNTHRPTASHSAGSRS
jgi:hypothetical protein